MHSGKRILLNSADLEELYRITKPGLATRTTLFIVWSGDKINWQRFKPNSQPLRGYRASQSHLDSSVRMFEKEGLWPDRCNVGIGVYEGGNLVMVLTAVKRGIIKSEGNSITRPLDDILNTAGIARK